MLEIYDFEECIFYLLLDVYKIFLYGNQVWVDLCLFRNKNEILLKVLIKDEKTILVCLSIFERFH